MREGNISTSLQKEIEEVFTIFDKDRSKKIDIDEAMLHWKSNYARLSAKEFFE